MSFSFSQSTHANLDEPLTYKSKTAQYPDNFTCTSLLLTNCQIQQQTLTQYALYSGLRAGKVPESNILSVFAIKICHQTSRS